MTTDTEKRVLADDLTNDVIAGLIAAVIAAVCLIPPVVHFISGPLGPLIGGAVGGYRAKARAIDSLIIGAATGVGMALMVVVLGEAFEGLFPLALSTTAIIIIAVIALIWGTIMGFFGGLVGGWWYRQSLKSP